MCMDGTQEEPRLEKVFRSLELELQAVSQEITLLGRAAEPSPAPVVHLFTWVRNQVWLAFRGSWDHGTRQCQSNETLFRIQTRIRWRGRTDREFGQVTFSSRISFLTRCWTESKCQ